MRPKLEAALGDQLRLGSLLGQGGFAAVFRAHDPFLQRDVAIKVLDPSLAVDADLKEQFLHEARTIAAAEHPHIVPLYSEESTGELLFRVMRLFPGHSLEGSTAGTALHELRAIARGEQVDGRSDVYALGVVLYEMLTGTAHDAHVRRRAELVRSTPRSSRWTTTRRAFDLSPPDSPRRFFSRA